MIVIGKLPDSVGVPESVGSLKVIPLGNAPVKENVYGEIPPLAENVSLKPDPTVPDEIVAGLTLIDGQAVQVFSSIVMVSLPPSEVAMSSLLSSLKSASATCVGNRPLFTGVGEPNPPLPLPSRIVVLALFSLEMARSRIPSRFRSPVATPIGAEPTA